MKVFLGGTCNDSEWRDKLIPLLKMQYFNPVVKDWTPECQANELRERAESDYVLYVTTPLMTGVYSIAEAVDDSNKRPEKLIFCYLETDTKSIHTTRFSKSQMKSLEAVASLITANGGTVLNDLNLVAEYLNGLYDKT